MDTKRFSSIERIIDLQEQPNRRERVSEHSATRRLDAKVSERTIPFTEGASQNEWKN